MNKAILDDIIKETDDSPKTDTSYVVKKLTDNTDIRKKVVFKTQSQAKAYSLLETIADRHNNKFLKSIISKNLEYNISVGGKGRQDVVEVAKFKGESEHGYMNRFLNFAGVKR